MSEETKDIFKIARLILEHEEFQLYPFSKLSYIWLIFNEVHPNCFTSFDEFFQVFKRLLKIFKLVVVDGFKVNGYFDEAESDSDMEIDSYNLSLTSIDFEQLKSTLGYLISSVEKGNEIPLHDEQLEDEIFEPEKSLHSTKQNDYSLISLQDVSSKKLFEILDKPLNSPFLKINDLLKVPLTLHILMQMKAKMRTPEKPFYTVCLDSTHINLLASINSNGSELSINFLEKVRNTNIELFCCCQSKIHYIPRITSFTDKSLGDCSYLDTCHRMKSCRYLHYYTLYPRIDERNLNIDSKEKQMEVKGFDYTLGDDLLQYGRPTNPPQWINCDIKSLPFLMLGKFAAIICDPSWDIHTMNATYGNSKDEELLNLPITELQDEGIMMLWVTGRSIETGRKALGLWNYEITDELVWVKLNQLRRTIVTGRTGHWLNHSKEHLLVGVKGNPLWLNKVLDSSIIASPTRETLRKPDEVYEIVERIVGEHSRKLELFGKEHNIREGWLTLGNQLPPTSIYEKELQDKYEDYYKRIEI